jgi:hypothetical protein
MFAQLPDPSSAQSIGWLVLSIAGLAVALRSVIGLWRDISRPTGADVQADSAGRYQPKGDYATRGDLVAMEARITAMSSASDHSRVELRAHIDTVVEGLDQRMDSMRKELAARIDNQAAEFGQALRDQPMQIVALLRNTGNLK